MDMVSLQYGCTCETRSERCGERSWLPISKMVWHFTIGSAVVVAAVAVVVAVVFHSYRLFINIPLKKRT